MASNYSMEKAAQAWCTTKTSGIVMDTRLAVAFAEILDVKRNQPRMGLATTRELLDEIRARIEINAYATNNPERYGLDYKTKELEIDKEEMDKEWKDEVRYLKYMIKKIQEHNEDRNGR